jgi:hypothetical protein
LIRHEVTFTLIFTECSAHIPCGRDGLIAVFVGVIGAALVHIAGEFADTIVVTVHLLSLGVDRALGRGSIWGNALSTLAIPLIVASVVT